MDTVNVALPGVSLILTPYVSEQSVMTSYMWEKPFLPYIKDLRSLYNPTTALLDIYPININVVQNAIYKNVFPAALVITAKTWKTFYCLITAG